MLPTHKAEHVWIDGRRYQKWGDKLFPGVTTVLSAMKDPRDTIGLKRWKAKIGCEEADRLNKEAQERGTEIHTCIESHLAGIERECDPQWKGFWDSIRPELNRVSNVQLIEGAIWHPRGFAGSVDCVAEWEGEMSIIDWKTSSKPKKKCWVKDYKMQAAAYCAGVNRLYQLEMANEGIEMIKRAVIAVALPDRPAQIFKIEPHEIMEYWNGFADKVSGYRSIFDE